MDVAVSHVTNRPCFNYSFGDVLLYYKKMRPHTSMVLCILSCIQWKKHGSESSHKTSNELCFQKKHPISGSYFWEQPKYGIYLYVNFTCVKQLLPTPVHTICCDVIWLHCRLGIRNPVHECLYLVHTNINRIISKIVMQLILYICDQIVTTVIVHFFIT